MSNYITDPVQIGSILETLESALSKNVPHKEQSVKVMSVLLTKGFSKLPLDVQLETYMSINSMLLSVINHETEETIQ